MRYTLIIVILFTWTSIISGREKIENKFSTFGIIAYDKNENTWGCALATNNIAIGQSGVYEIVPDIGIVVSIAFTNPDYPIKGIEMLKNGNPLQSTFNALKSKDDYYFNRQIAMIDNLGNTFGFTGNAIKSYSHAGTIEGNGYVVLGNSLTSASVLKAIESGYLNSNQPLYQRLLNALVAGQESGGQMTGKLSASICVKKSGLEGFNEVDYRVDYSKTPFQDMQFLINKKSGIELLRKANRIGNKDSAIMYLDKASFLLKDWTLLYPELAKSYYKNGKEDKAIDLLENRISKDSLFIHFLPTCYYLNTNERYQELISNLDFEIHEWLEAIYSLLEFEKNEEALQISDKILDKYSDSSYLNFLTGKVYENLKKDKKAIEYYKTSVKLDGENIEAKNALDKLKNK